MKQPLAVLLVLVSCVPAARAQQSFAGVWDTSEGRMYLKQDGKRATGFYQYHSGLANIEGTLDKARFTFTYQEPSAKGSGSFDLAADGETFKGTWREAGSQAAGAWTGTRLKPGTAAPKFEGVWQTTFGRMRLVDADGGVEGVYQHAGGSSVKGTVTKNALSLKYSEPGAQGEAEYEMMPDGKAFLGKWRVKGSKNWSAWNGLRVEPEKGRNWLVVIEANWETNLADKEYALGTMLRPFLARASNVQVRHRFFTDESSLLRWCREICYLAEPVCLVIAAHGSSKGVALEGGRSAGAKALAETLRHASNLKLLHFSSCEVLKGRMAADIQAAVPRSVMFPVSGYTTTADWAASAMVDFLFLDLILTRGLSPEQAAGQVVKLMPFAGDKTVEGSALKPLGFRFVKPAR